MAKHRRTYSKKKVAPSLVLGASVLSVCSPLTLLLHAPTKPTPEPPQETTQEFFIPPHPTAQPEPAMATVTATSTKVEKKPQRKVIPPSSLPTSTTRPKVLTTTTTPTTSSVRPSATTTRATPPPHTTIAQKPTQAATRSSTPAQKPPPRTTATPTPPPKPTPKIIPATSTASFANVVSVAKKYIDSGIPYHYGGNTLKGGMDCSHFIWMVLKEAGYNVPYRDSAGLAGWTKRTTDPQPGDLVLYKGHAGIYVSPGMMIDQGSAGGAHLRKIFKQNFIGYGRLPL